MKASDGFGLGAVICACLLACNCACANAIDEPDGSADFIFRSSFDSVPVIEWIQRNSTQLVGYTRHIGPAIVTGMRTSANTIFFVEVPPGLGTATYPMYSGIKAFSSAPLAGLQIGDCVSLDGTIVEFNGATELSPISNAVTEPSGCGTITPQVVSEADIATDLDPNTAGNQSGAFAEVFEGVLVRVNSVTATSPPISGVFPVVATASGGPESLSVSSFLFTYSAMMGEQFSSITGVLDEQDTGPGGSTIQYLLLPRASADIVH